MREEKKGRREGDRVTRRSGTKLFGRSDVRSTERIHAFDEDREDVDVRRRPRDAEEYRAARRRDTDDGYWDEPRSSGEWSRDARSRSRDAYSYDRPRSYDEERYERSRSYDEERYGRPRGHDEERYERTRGYEGERYARRAAYEDEERDSRRRAPRRAEGAQTARRQTVKAPAAAADTELFLHQVVPYVMFWLALFAAVSFVLRDIAGLSEGAGVIGNWFADFLNGLLGIAAYLLPLFMMVLALKWKRFVREGKLAKKILLSASFLVLLSAIIHIFQDRADLVNVLVGSDTLFHNGVMRRGGGFFGGFVGEWLGKGLRLPGTCLLAIPLLFILGIYLVDLTPSGLWQRLHAKIKMMRRQGREERGARSVKGTDEDARERMDDRGSDGGWRQPQALSAGAYDFHEDEPDVAVTPSRAKVAAESEIDTSDISRRAASAFGAHRADAVRDILDIPDDEPEIAPPSAGARTILEGAAHGTDHAGQTLADILRDLAEPAAQETAATQEQPAAPTASAPDTADTSVGARGDYYAPFALPIRPEPRREKRVTAAAPAAEMRDMPMGGYTDTPVADVTADGVAEESLGSVRTTPYRTAAAARPVHQMPVYRNPAEAYRVDPAVSGLSFAEEQVSEEPTFGARFEAEPVVTERHSMEAAAVIPFAEPVVSDDEAHVVPEALLDFDMPDIGTASDETPLAPVSSTVPDVPAPTVFERNPFAMLDTDSAEEASEISEEASAIPATPAAPAVTRESVVDARPAYVPPAAAAPAPVAAPTPAVRVEAVKTEPTPAPVPVPRRPYTRPHVGLLAEDQNVRTSDFYEEIEETKQILRDTLESFNIHIQDQISYSHGPSVTRYELRPVAGTSVRSVTNRIDDIALNLAASVRIEAPIPGKPAIGIEVPNKVRETVYMRTMLESDEYRRSFKPLEVPLGLDVGGAVRMCNLAAMPHLLIAGTTGSGKSVCINAILLSLIFKTSPDDLRLILIDPKQIEFAPYEHVPHLYMPIVTDMQRAAGALACAVQEMERRFSLIRDVGVRNIEAYNEAVKNDPDREHLPYIIIVIDEFADLKMSVANNDPENFTCRIAQKARAAGIHLIIGTQRPSVDVITGKLKTNIPSRIAFMVKQQVDSRTILDVNGAESLTGRGDMLYMASNSSDKAPVRVQGAYVSDKELEDVISYVRSHNDPVQYNQAFMDQIEIEMARAQSGGKKGDADDFGDMDSDGGEDPKFIEAVKLAVETQKVATSLLQRRIGVGYGRAAKIIDRMEELGLVSAAEGNKPRQILPAAQGYLNHIAAGGDMGPDDDGSDSFDDYVG